MRRNPLDFAWRCCGWIPAHRRYWRRYAMESAWMLARMLRYATRENVAFLLSVYERSQKPRVESAQGASRELAGMMFRQSRLLAIFRDLLMRIVSVEVAIKPIQKLVATTPDPDGIAKKALKKQPSD